jgi:16S rRNA (guanine1516-N2)-methyltransferase
MTSLRLAVLVESLKVSVGVDEQKMMTLARQLALPVVTGLPIKRITNFDAVLHESPGGLALQLTGKGAPGPVMVDFVGGAVAHRRRFGGGKGQGIAKAVGLADSGRRPLHVFSLHDF